MGRGWVELKIVDDDEGYRWWHNVMVEGSACLKVNIVIFFFKQKTAYEMLRSLVGSEMCIRDSICIQQPNPIYNFMGHLFLGDINHPDSISYNLPNCLLYTSDAADDLLCVDLGGRRIIKKKTYHNPLTLTSI